MCSTAWREKGLLRMWMDVEKAVFEAYAISVALLVIKVMAMGPLTARQRFKHMVIKHCLGIFECEMQHTGHKNHKLDENVFQMKLRGAKVYAQLIF